MNGGPQVFGEILTQDEVEFCERARNELSAVSWAKPLLAKIPPLEQLNKTAKPFLFELRFALELHRRNLTAQYEYPAGVGSSTIDFRVIHGEVEWLIELVSIATSAAVEAATTENDHFFATMLSTDSKDPKQSLEGELLLVQQKIAAKVYRDEAPIKFPRPSTNSYNVIVADVRGFGITGGDAWDYREVAYGPAGLTEGNGPLRHYWKGQPILGLFDPANSRPSAHAVRDRVHLLGFCNDQRYELGGIPEHSYYLANPHLLAPTDAATRVYQSYPMRRGR